jgi:hypothetical protein
MRTLTLLFVFAFLSSCGQQTGKASQQKQITRSLQQDINALIPAGEITVDVMDQVSISPRRAELQAKFMQAMKENPDWFLQQQKLVESTGQAVAYDPRLGMMEEEWNEYKILLENMNDMNAVSSGKEKLTVTKQNCIIRFRAGEKLSSLNSTMIDTKNNIVKVFDYTLTPTDTICVTNPDNGFKSSWRGYKWQFSNPSDVSMPTSSEELADLSMSLYSFTVGLFDKTGKTYIEIAGSETKQGKQIVRYRIPIVFQ